MCLDLKTARHVSHSFGSVDCKLLVMWLLRAGGGAPAAVIDARERARLSSFASHGFGAEGELRAVGDRQAGRGLGLEDRAKRRRAKDAARSVPNQSYAEMGAVTTSGGGVCATNKILLYRRGLIMLYRLLCLWRPMRWQNLTGFWAQRAAGASGTRRRRRRRRWRQRRSRGTRGRRTGGP